MPAIQEGSAGLAYASAGSAARARTTANSSMAARVGLRVIALHGYSRVSHVSREMTAPGSALPPVRRKGRGGESNHGVTVTAAAGGEAGLRGGGAPLGAGTDSSPQRAVRAQGLVRSGFVSAQDQSRQRS